VSWVYKGSTAEWLTLRIPQTNHKRTITCTPNHEIYTPEGKKLAKDLRPGDKVYIKSDLISEEQNQLILGTLLGDSSLLLDKHSFSNPRLSIPHSIKQKEYLMWKAKELANLDPVIETHRTSGFGSQMLCVRTKASPSLRRYYSLRYPKSHAYRSMDELTLRGLAVWCMDDGSLANNPFQRPRFKIHANRYPKSTVERMAKSLTNKFGYQVNPRNYGKGFVLQFDTDSTETLIEDLAPYFHPSLSYKLNLKPKEVGEKLRFPVKRGE